MKTSKNMLEAWLEDQNKEFTIQTGKPFDNEELDIMRGIYKRYANKEGYVDWEDHSIPDSAWYEFMSAVMKLPDSEPEYEPNYYV